VAPAGKRLVVGLDRFDWLSAEGDKPQFRRCRAALRFERVAACRCKHVNPAGKGAVAEPPGRGVSSRPISRPAW